MAIPSYGDCGWLFRQAPLECLSPPLVSPKEVIELRRTRLTFETESEPGRSSPWPSILLALLGILVTVAVAVFL